MSAYVVDDKTINIVVSSLIEQSENRESWIYREIKKLGYIPGMPEMMEKLAQDMFNLNCESVNQRYGTGQAEKFRPLDFKFKREYPSNNMIVLKSLSCFLYQACEGNCNETPLYKALADYRGRLSYHIVSRMKEYETAAGW